MANIQRICPVCGSVSENRRENDTRCPNCQEPLAFVQQFGGEEAYAHWKQEMEAKKEALKKYGDQLLWKKLANHYKLNIEMLSQRRIDLAVENKALREA
jgi:uncharacterized Zn finger protein (UPF0148 family)